jgi:hypothetical protein
MTRFKTVQPLMIYVPPGELAELRRYAKSLRKPVSHVAREGIRMRMAGNSPYDKGFADGCTAAQQAVQETEGAKMMFPSGKSFADLVCESIQEIRIRNVSEQ